MELSAVPLINLTGLKLFPNPSTEKLWLQWQNNEEAPESFQIFNSTGSLLHSGYFSGKGLESVDIQALPPGFYAIHFHFKSGKYNSARFIKS